MAVDIEVVDIRKVTGDSALKAFADVKIGGGVLVRGFSVVKGKNGVFVSMPRKPGKDGKWYDILTPLSEDMKREFEDRVLEAYDKETDGVR
ncbi:MAG: hypothetical protein A3D28_02940 [Omnitrophica bacterium RIFCSPHIGHO2_02_FULL_63_14]|nr:MAG: hypothetical protein A3D28_02940 [Omnitrophica bacterium RIFCSPHIGHO2_02_FULL_63_14]